MRVVVLLAVVGLVSTCKDERKSALGETCSRTADCEAEHQCIDSVCVDLAAIRKEAERASRELHERRRACAESEDCKQRGRCTWNGGACVVDNDSDCRDAQVCKTIGACSALAGRCLAMTREDCRRTDGCRLQARCTPDLNGTCVRTEGDYAWEPSLRPAPEMEKAEPLPPAYIPSGTVVQLRAIGLAATVPLLVGTDPAAAETTIELKPDAEAVVNDVRDLSMATRRGIWYRVTERRRKGRSGWALAAVVEPSVKTKCRQSGDCTAYGKCSLHANGRCIAATNSDCSRGLACQNGRHCIARDGACGLR
jgi:hypothetical protein